MKLRIYIRSILLVKFATEHSPVLVLQHLASQQVRPLLASLLPRSRLVTTICRSYVFYIALAIVRPTDGPTARRTGGTLERGLMSPCHG